MAQIRLLVETGCAAASRRTGPAAVAWARLPVEAAILLHTDAAGCARRADRPTGAHDDASVAIAELLKEDTLHELPPGFLRAWYEAVASLAHAETRWDDALAWCERGLREFPDSARLHLVAGSVLEVQAGLAAHAGGPDPAPSTSQARERLRATRDSRSLLERARRAVRQALALDPELTEARLRLGRIAYLLGEPAEAQALLEGVRRRQRASETTFDAHLFLARLHEDAGRLEEASRCYEAALAVDPRAQSARLGLSFVRLLQGARQAAADEVEAALEAAGGRPRPDPFWLYPWGSSVDAEPRLEALRRQVSR